MVDRNVDLSEEENIEPKVECRVSLRKVSNSLTDSKALEGCIEELDEEIKKLMSDSLLDEPTPVDVDINTETESEQSDDERVEISTFV